MGKNKNRDKIESTRAMSGRTERLARAALQATRKLEESIALDGRWGRVMEDGAVVTFVKCYDADRPNKGYTYVAIRVNGGWFLSGQMTHALQDDEFIEFVGDSEARLATAWDDF